VARVLQNGKANGSERENGWKEVTEKAGQEGHDSREFQQEEKESSNKKLNAQPKL